MLTHLYIRHFTIIDSSELEFDSGMTALTGETGAGKSILLDALALVIGARANAHSVQQGADRAEIIATFDILDNPKVGKWLQLHELDEDDECLLRRTLGKNGKSRASINDRPVSAQLLKELGAMLISIHGQHAHQTLSNSQEQRHLLDEYAPSALLDRVANSYDNWHAAEQELRKRTENANQLQQRIDLLQFQLREFDELDIGATPAIDIEKEHRWLANAEELIALGNSAVQALEKSAEPALNSAARSLEQLTRLDDNLREALDLVESAAIQSAEAASALRTRVTSLEHDDSRLAWLDEKLGKLHSLVRKHQCSIEELPAFELTMREELDQLLAPETQLDELIRERDAFAAIFDKDAEKLSRHRLKSAKKLSKVITEAMQSLNMTGGTFRVDVAVDLSVRQRTGQDQVQFMVSPNPGTSPQALSKIASGGELSRISLCIQLATIESHQVSTLIFDEVDAGIGGAVAVTVGQLLRRVGSHAQVLCVTHLPQVAAQAHQHLSVRKTTEGGKTKTSVHALNSKQTRDEIARMLGGAKVTSKSRQHAQEMLDAVVEQ
ncbi:MAG: DNA repair protein RecN [Granulosicoccus sp.]